MDTSPAPSPWTDGTLALLARLRPNVADLSAAAERAVLNPRDPGGWPARWRMEAAARICAINGLAARADALRDAAAAAPAGPAMAPETDTAARRFADAVAAAPRDVTADDLGALRAAGVSDADIVRLCELVAFVSYQCRVEVGHALLGAAQ